jgi:hypothetical protein
MTSDEYYEDRMACRGAAVLEAWHDMAECRACGRYVRWDMRDDKFWGFEAGCEHAKPVTGAGTRPAGETR